MPEKPGIPDDEDQKTLTVLPDAPNLVCCSSFPAGYLQYGIRNTCTQCKLGVVVFNPNSTGRSFLRKYRVGPNGTIVIDVSWFFRQYGGGTYQLVNDEDCAPIEGGPMLGDVKTDFNKVQENYAKHMQTTQWYAMCEYGHEPWIAPYLRYSEVHAQADADAHDSAAHGGSRTAIVLPYD